MKKDIPAATKQPTQKIGTPVPNTGKTLYLGFNRLCDIEELMDAPFGTIMEHVADKLDLRTVRACLRKALEEYHGEDATTNEVADELLQEVGLPVAAKALVDEMNATLGGAAKRKLAA